ncbi:MAG TPA: hypothetical protein VK154_10185 [Chitinophagales bacterium]|nr:hypothetical protein [Chitinophagales bacterium]
MPTVRIISEYAQTIYDVAIENYGSAEGVFALMADNPDVIPDLNTTLPPGSKLQIKSPPVNEEMHQYLTGNKLRIATGIGIAPDGEPLLNLNDDFLKNVPDTPFYNL